MLPILHGERLVARADLRMERDGDEPVMRVLSLHWEDGRRPERAVAGALRSLAGWRRAELVTQAPPAGG